MHTLQEMRDRRLISLDSAFFWDNRKVKRLQAMGSEGKQVGNQ